MIIHTEDTGRKYAKLFLLSVILSFFIIISFSLNVHAADTDRAITVYSSNYSMGAVSAFKNNVSFNNCTYAVDTDYITVHALVLNTHYCFKYWTNNGQIVSDSTVYSFNCGGGDHTIVAHFEVKESQKHKKADSDDNISGLKPNTKLCSFSSGYYQPGMTINCSLASIDTNTQTALQAITGGTFSSAYKIVFTYGYDSAPKNTLKYTTRLTINLPESFWQGANTFHVVDLSGSAPVILKDLDSNNATVTFETNHSGLFALTYGNGQAVPIPVPAPTAPVPAAPVQIQPSVPAALPAQPVPVAPVTEEEYNRSVINVLRYQLQQAGITPLA